MTEQQDHPLADGSTLTIYRDGKHRYWTDEDKVKRPSVSTIVSYVDGNSFDAAVGWATKLMRETNDPYAAKKSGEQSRLLGSQLHDEIDKYIRRGDIAENPAFMSWYKAVGNLQFLAAEQFVYHPTLKYGGTLDQVALDGDKIIIQDVKSVDSASWAKYGSNNRKGKDWAQVAAYVTALNKQAMNSKYQALYAQIVYVMRDGSGVAIEDVDLNMGLHLFKASRTLYKLHKELGK
jgi:hypothetical protein